MSSYPNSIYSPRTRTNKSGVIYAPTKQTILYANDVNNSDAEISAIETELGTLPKGSKADVKTRLNDVDSLLGAHKTRHENGGTDEISVAGLSGELADAQPPKFEEGDWTAGFTATSGTITINNSYKTGRYIKIGNQVTVTGNFRVSAINSPSGTLLITGLPYAIGTGNKFEIGGLATNWNTTGNPFLQIRGNSGSSSLEIILQAGGDAAGIIQASPPTTIYISITYFTA